jgi:hypothetical protein
VFSRELRSARDRIAELRRRSGASQRYGGLLPEATLAFLRAQEHAMKGPCVHALLPERPVQAAGLADDPRGLGRAGQGGADGPKGIDADAAGEIRTRVGSLA